MTLTKAEQEARRTPHRYRGKWFYLNSGTGPEACSFHTLNQNMLFIPATVLLRALQRTGLLRQWDRKRQVLRKIAA